MDNSYCFKSVVRYSEIDAGERLTIPSIINYFQDCTTFHSESLGVGVEYLKEKKCAWILSSWVVEIIKYPMFNQEITVRTWATGFKGIFGYRNFAMEDKEGNVLVRANSLWVFLNLTSGRLIKAPEEMTSLYGNGEPMDMEAAPRKMKLPKEVIVCEPVKVRKAQIDTNQHMNNCQYVADALELIEPAKAIVKIRAEYKKSAVYGDTIYPKLAKDENKHIVELCDADGAVYAIVELCEEE